MQRRADPNHRPRRYAVVPGNTNIVDWVKWSKWAEDFLIPRIKAFVREFGPNSLPDPHLTQVFADLSHEFRQYEPSVDQITFLSPLPTFPSEGIPLPKFTPVRVRVTGVAMLTKSVPIVPWPGSASQPPRRGLVLLASRPTVQPRTVAGPRCMEAYDINGGETHNYGVDGFLAKFAEGRLDKVSQPPLPYTYHPLNGDRWSSKTRVGVEPESEWSVHLQGWPGEIEIMFACPVNPHQVVAR